MQTVRAVARHVVPAVAVAALMACAPASAAPPVKATLSFATAPQTIAAGAYSGTITVRLSGASGPATVSLSTTSLGGQFRDAANTKAITAVTIASGQTSASFLYRDTVAGSAQLGALAKATAGQFNGAANASQTETITPAAPASILISPASALIAAGGTQTFTASGRDAFGNSTGTVTAQATFSMAPNGSCSGATCTATISGPHTVTATYAGLTSSATVTVTPGALNHLAISPASSTIAAGAAQSFTATGRDVYDNVTGDVTTLASFAIAPDGTCTASTCSTTTPGAHTVTATYSGLTAGAALTVTPGALDHLTLTPATASVVAGSPQGYTVNAFDSFNNVIGDISTTAALTIGPDGSCASNVCTPASAGPHTVTAASGGKQATATLFGISTCTTSGPAGGAYTLTLCLSPADGATVSGSTPVTATITIAGTDPHTAKVIVSLDGKYLLTDYQTPYTFTLPTTRWTDGPHVLSAYAIERDGFTSQPAAVGLTFANGVTTPPGQATGFQPTTGTTPGAGTPYVLGAVGDGAGGELGAGAVSDLIAGWNPNLFLYLGDVYEKGTPTEFLNWYGAPGGNFFGRFRSITNPTIGNHEYENGVAPGYFDYWASPPDYYSVDTPAGWHIVSLNSNLSGVVGSAQYAWLDQDLTSSTAACTLVYFHHPLFNIGVEPIKAGFTDMWPLLAQHGVDVVLTGHDHDYQRWVPLGADGSPDPSGPTEFVVGTGGHSMQSFVSTDSRVANSASGAFGAIRFDLSPGGASYQYVTTAGDTLDSGAISCNAGADTQPPTPPTNLTATSVAATTLTPGSVRLAWSPSVDDVSVAGYRIVRDGAQIASIGPKTTFTDASVDPNTTYTYEVRAFDLAGNVSDPNPTVTVQTPPVAPIFADGFESGDVSKWSPTAGMVAQQTDVVSGAWAAEATAATTAATGYGWKTLSSSLTDVYYRVRFKVVSMSASSVYLERFRTGPTATSILGVFISSTGKLGFRNDVTGVSTTATTTPVSLGVWHTLQVHVNVADTASLVETWLDGSPVAVLTGTQSLGANPVTRVQLGDNSTGKTFVVRFDDVAVDTVPLP